VILSDQNVVISGTGLYTPPFTISNEELVQAYNEWAERYNAENADAIAAGEAETVPSSSVDFIVKASGIRQRYMMEKAGVVDPERLRARLSPAAEQGTFFGVPAQVVMALGAAGEALDQAGLEGADIDLVIFSSSVFERFVPSIAVEIQETLGAGGHAYDMAVGCSSATFGISNAMDAVRSGMAKRALVITSEYITPAMNFRDRDSHFIFGDACVAAVVEMEHETRSVTAFRIRSRKLSTSYSMNIRAGFGSRLLLEEGGDLLTTNPNVRFLQNGRKVFKELVPAVIKLVKGHMAEQGIRAGDVRRIWLHQANIHMNTMAARKLLGKKVTEDQAPMILDEFANTAGAGCLIAFHRFKADFKRGEVGILCSFGAGYSIGCLVLERV
jgi:beta-ketodecanoyl-[acyl-carrier-protein] synthase